MSETVVDNRAWADATPRLSVLIPFMRDDPCQLLRALDGPVKGVEVIVLDDGTGDPELTAKVAVTAQEISLPCRFISLARNEGRAKGRNRLTRHARAARFLFLDSDMLPDSTAFLVRWLDLVEEQDPAVAFGGFSVIQAPRRREHALHRMMAMGGDCAPASVRRQSPEKFVFTSNLLVRRDVFEAEAFDEAFTGWGWEDVEWAMRVSRRWPIVHVDNTATHLGLDTARTLAAKYEQSVANFARVTASHREIVETYPSYKVARLLKFAPLRPLWRPLIKALSVADALPVKPRAFLMRLYRASLYAEAV